MSLYWWGIFLLFALCVSLSKRNLNLEQCFLRVFLLVFFCLLFPRKCKKKDFLTPERLGKITSCIISLLSPFDPGNKRPLSFVTYFLWLISETLFTTMYIPNSTSSKIQWFLYSIFTNIIHLAVLNEADFKTLLENA